jgi:hypothetical protein
VGPPGRLCRLFRVVSGVLPLPLVGETIGVDRGPQRRGGLLEGDGQRVDLAGQLSALVRNHLIGGGLGRVDALADGVMMTARVVELHRVLKPTGSLYLHCDPTASHYLKVLMDAIFTPMYFRNLKYEIDFRSVYQTLIRDWLQGDAATVLGATYPELPVINKA